MGPTWSATGRFRTAVWHRDARPRHATLCGTLLAGWLGLGLLLAGCDGAPPPADRQPQDRLAPPQAQVPTPPVATQPATQPVATQPTTQPATTQPEEAEPETPDYLTILDRFNSRERASASARVEPGNRLVIDTRNVRRLRIERRELPLDARRTIVLQLDGQGIEWLAKSRVVEFERSPNGEWMPVKPSRSGRP
jgi:hypothetical protein